jgi:hypothetical protein
MQTTIADKSFVFIDEVLKKHVHSLAKVYDRNTRGEIDDIQMSDELLKIVIVTIDWNDNKESFQEIFDNLKFQDYQELVKISNDLVQGEKKSDNSSTSTKRSSTAEAEGSPKNG